MKYILILFFWSVVTKAQEPKYYLKPLDTIFIFYNENIKKDFVLKSYKEIKLARESLGLEEKFQLLSFESKRQRDVLIKKLNDEKKRNVIVARDIDTLFYGVSLIRNEANYKYISNLNKYRTDEFNYLKINPKYKNDSISFDKRLYAKEYVRSETNIYSSLIKSKSFIENKNVFIFDGTESKSNELWALLNEPHIFYIFDQLVPTNNRQSLLFKEVVLAPIRRTL